MCNPVGRRSELRPACESPSPNMFISSSCLHSRRAFPGIRIHEVSTSGGGWSFVCWSYMLLRHAVKFTVVPLATLPAISGVNLCFPDSARAALSNKPTAQKAPRPPFNLFVDLMKNSPLENTFPATTREVNICASNSGRCVVFFFFFYIFFYDQCFPKCAECVGLYSPLK